jgi:hypothetical protein
MGADGIEERIIQYVIITDGDLTKIKAGGGKPEAGHTSSKQNTCRR